MDNSHKVLVIINPISGTGDKKEMPALVRDTLDSSRWEFEIRFTEYPGHATELAKEAASQGWHSVVAIGGDGTLNEVAAALVDTKTALGLVPCGSGNGFARHLHIPTQAKKALEIINEGYTEQVDYCRVNGQPFFCTCGAGFDAQVSHYFSRAGSRGLATYLKTTINTYFKYGGEHFRISVDDEVIEENAYIVTCCNAAQYGNNAFIAPRASMQDGLIDITIIRNFNIIDGSLLGLRLITNHIEDDRHAHFYRGRNITIERRHPGIIQIDGDPQYMPQRLEITNINKGLKVILPNDCPTNI